MANTIELAQKYLPILDEVYKRASLTGSLDANTIDFSGGNTVKVFKIDMQGLANYDRNDGFTKGNVNGSWEVMTLTKDRARTFLIDRMDNEETLNQSFGNLVGEFLRTKVVPEIDAYRFAKYAGTSGISSDTGTLDVDNIVGIIDGSIAEMDENEVPIEGRILYITPTNYTLLKQQKVAVTRFATMQDNALNRDFEYFDGMRIIKVPQTRFYTAITLNDGKTGGQEAGSYVKAGDDINFMIIHPSAVLQVKKHVLPRIFGPDVTQQADAWKFDYRIYHDVFVFENKTKGIYLHSAQDSTARIDKTPDGDKKPDEDKVKK